MLGGGDGSGVGWLCTESFSLQTQRYVELSLGCDNLKGFKKSSPYSPVFDIPQKLVFV